MKSGPVLLAAVLLVSLAVHRSAWQGYFEDDDLDTLTWARIIPLRDLVADIPSLKYPPEHARPTGYFYFAALYRRVGLDYLPYVAVLQIVCALDVVLLWLLLCRVGLDPVASAAGCLFFALHRALFDAWWKPMFIYDVLCVTFALASLVAYAHRRWVLSFLAFWLAMRSKEVGIVVPAILLCYEMTLGQRNWKRALIFFLPAAVYGVYGLAFNQRQHSPYTLRFNLAALWKSTAFYFSRLLSIPYAGFAFLLLPFAIRDRRVWFGAGTLVLGLSIYLFLPGRLLEVYLYAAMTGAAIVVGALVAIRPAIALPLLLVWTGWQVLLIHKNARHTLTDAADRRAFVAAIQHVPDSPIYVYDKVPESMRSWGVEGALRLFHSNLEHVHRLENDGLPTAGDMLLLQWDARTRQLRASPFSPTPFTYIRMGEPVAPWELVEGWQKEGEIGEHAIARLYRPPAANDFEWEACADHAILRTFVAGQELTTMHLEGCQQGKWQLKPAPPGLNGVHFLTAPKNQAVRIKSFGFGRH